MSVQGDFIALHRDYSHNRILSVVINPLPAPVVYVP